MIVVQNISSRNALRCDQWVGNWAILQVMWHGALRKQAITWLPELMLIKIQDLYDLSSFLRYLQVQ